MGYNAVVGFSVNLALGWQYNEPLVVGRKNLVDLSIGITGSSLNIARIMQELGHQCCLIALIGDDFLGELIEKELKEELDNVMCFRVRQGTSVGASLIGPSGLILSYKPKLDHQLITESVLDSLLHITEETEFQIVSSLADDLSEVGLARRIWRNQKILIPSPALIANKDFFCSLLPEVDILFLNHEEAALFLHKDSGEISLGDSELIQEYGAKMVIITMGKRGSFLLSKDGFRFEQEPFFVGARSTTAAGDAFVAGFVVAQLENRTVEDSMRFASAVAAAKVTKPLAWIIPTRREVEEILSR